MTLTNKNDGKMDVGLRIMRLLLNEGGDRPMREIARRLKLPSSTVYYHQMRLVKLGILVREEVVRGHIRWAYYTPQPMFTEDMDGTLELLNRLAEKVDDANDDKLVNCLAMFLKCYGNG